MMKQLNIKYRLLLYILLPILTILLTANAFFYFRTTNFLEEKSDTFLLEQGKSIKKESEHIIEVAKRTLSFLLLNRTIADYFLYSDLGLLDKAEDLRWEIEQDLLKGVKEIPEYVTIRISGLDGKSIVDIIDQKISYRHYDLSKGLSFQKALKSEEGEWAISYNICEEHKRPGLLFATSFFNDSGKKIGIASIHVHIEEFFKGLVNLKIGENGYAYLIDSKGMIIAHPDQNKIGIKINDQIKLLSTKVGITEGIEENGKRLLKKVFIPLDIEGLSLIVTQPISEIHAFGKQVRFNNIMLIFLTVFVIIIISLIAANQFTKPIIKLKEMAVSVGKGNLNSKIDIKSNDEIGTLANAFNNMTQQIRESFNEINAEITERKQAEEALRESERRLTTVLESVQAGIIIIDVETREIVDANPAALRMIGTTRDEVIGSVCHQFICPAERDHCPICDLGQSVDHSERTLLTAQSETVPIIKNVVSVALGGRNCLVESFISIAELKLAEEELKKHRDKLEEMVEVRTRDLQEEVNERRIVENQFRRERNKAQKYFDIAGVMFVVINADQTVALVNKKGSEVLGYDEGEIIGMNWFDNFLPDKDRERTRSVFHELIAGKIQPVEYFENPVLTRDDEERLIAWHNAVFRDEQGNIIATVSSGEDITERRQTEEELQKAKEAAEAANRAKSEFLASMSHELRTPLNAILGYAQLLKRQKNLTANQTEQLATIQSSGEHLLTLISDILDLARIEAQKVVTESNVFNLPALIHSVLNITKIKAEAKELSVQYEKPSSIPQAVMGDERKLRQVLLNLLDNAVKYTESGSVTLRASVVSGQWSALKEDTTDEGRPRTKTFRGRRTRDEEELIMSDEQPYNGLRTLRFEIEDTGIGIPEERLEEIFEPFTHGEADGRLVEGTGLGLSISRSLIELMGGRLSVESPSTEFGSRIADHGLGNEKEESKIQIPKSKIVDGGPGSTFTVELALPVAEETVAAIHELERPVIGYKGEGKSILIVDDNITNLSMLVSMLEPLGFEIITAEAGEEAIGKAEAFKPNLVLLDLLMPGMDGHEALRRMRENVALKDTRIIGVSAAVADRDRAEAFATDCDDFLPKPVDLEALLETLQTHLQIEWIEAELERPVMPESPVDDGKPARRTADKPARRPPMEVIEEIARKVEWGDYAGLERILDRLEAEAADYGGFCSRIREYARNYDDEAILKFIRAEGRGTGDEGRGTKDERRRDDGRGTEDEGRRKKDGGRRTRDEGREDEG